jgi:DNA-binding transcriptional ArsR family regulator
MARSTKQRYSANSALAKAFAHPLRVKAFLLLAQGTWSPKEIADMLGEESSDVSYHVRQLEKFGMIEMVNAKQVRGAVQHFYRAVARPMMSDEEWANLSLEERLAVSRFGIQLVIGDAVLADDAGTFDARADRHLSRTPMEVDLEGWRELQDLHNETMGRVLEIQAASAERLAKSEGKGSFPVVSSTMCFELPEGVRFATAQD